MIRFGPAGIPLSCKGRTLKDGIEDVHNLSLTAIEIQMVRPSVYPRPPEDEEVGMTLRDIVDDFVIEIIRDDLPVNSPDVEIDEEDDLLFISSPISSTFGSLYTIGEIAQRMDVSVSMHAPNYMDLGTDTPLAGVCMDSLRHAALMVNALDGDTVVTSLGLYDTDDRESVDAHIYENLDLIMEWWNDEGIKPNLGVEISGHQDTFGSLEQIIDLCKEFDNIVPVLNFPRHHARTSGSLMEAQDFLDVIEAVEPYSKGCIYSQFAGVEHSDGEERRITPIKKGDLRFETLSDALTEVSSEMKIISCSPLLEHDAMYMRIIAERVLSKKVAKNLREKKKQTAEASGE
ncbi:MAG TPA: TIM barrel protein [Candidatus Methanomethylophilaceae archaeon]|nr:TIM barrel protein [Candidatus Methanomethylophilaceae archaeon]